MLDKPRLLLRKIKCEIIVSKPIKPIECYFKLLSIVRNHFCMYANMYLNIHGGYYINI